MSEDTVEDRERRYLVPVARLNLPDQPDMIHLSVYQWLPALDGWATGMAICGSSTQQGPLLKAAVTCPECLAYRPRYERMLAPGYRPEDDDPDVLRARAERAERQVEQAKELAAKWHEAAARKGDAAILVGVAGDVLMAALERGSRGTVARFSCCGWPAATGVHGGPVSVWQREAGVGWISAAGRTGVISVGWCLR